MEGDWIELATRVTGKTQHVVPRKGEGQVGSLGAGSKLGLYIDLGAATQSSRRAAKDAGLLYVGIDKREWVYSAAEMTWVQNWAMDFTAMSPSQLWCEVRDMVREEVGIGDGMGDEIPGVHVI